VGIFQRVERLISSYIGDAPHSGERGGAWERDYDAAYAELEEFLRGGGRAADGGAAAAAEKPRFPNELRADLNELGLAPGAPFEDCKAAYKRLVKIYHPDSGKNADKERFLRVKAAYDRIEAWHARRGRGA
jgi:DnaJ-domain-containing protein 1